LIEQALIIRDCSAGGVLLFVVGNVVIGRDQ
jgi:hypothetical protein